MLDAEDTPISSLDQRVISVPEQAASRSNVTRLVDEVPPVEFEIAHPLETLARRPRRHPPKWLPRVVPAVERGVPRSTLEGWHSPRLVTDPKAGAVKIEFKYCHFAGATAVFSDKAKRQQFMSGPHEKARWRLLESTAEIVDFQFQPFTIVWTKADGGERRYTVDTLELHRNGRLVAREEKADPAFHADPDTDDLLGMAEAFLATKGIEFVRSVGQPDDLAWRTQRLVANQRRFDFSSDELLGVRRELASGSSDVGRLVTAIGGHPEVAVTKLRSMTARGLVAIGTDRPWTYRTRAAPVDSAVRPRRLREFLREHASEPPGRHAS